MGHRYNPLCGWWLSDSLILERALVDMVICCFYHVLTETFAFNLLMRRPLTPRQEHIEAAEAICGVIKNPSVDLQEGNPNLTACRRLSDIIPVSLNSAVADRI